MMLVSRPYYQRTSPRASGFRPTLKMPNTKSYSSFDPNMSFEKSISESDYVERHYRATSPFKNLIELSTPSPSATANGNVVDFEFEKFRRLSEEWIRNRDIEESLSAVVNLHSRSPSPQRTIRGKSPARSRSASPEKSQRSYRNSTSPESNFYMRPSSPDKNTHRRSLSQEKPIPSRILTSRSPSPLRYSPLTKTFIREDNSSPEKSIGGYTNSRSQSPLDIPAFRRSSSYDRDSASSSTSVTSNLFKRSNSYTSRDQIPSNFLRSRSASPHGLRPASSYFQKSNGVEERERNYSSTYSRSALNNKNNLRDIPENNYSKLKSLHANNKFNTLPSARYFNRRVSPGRDTFLGALFNSNSSTSGAEEQIYPFQPTRRLEQRYFLPKSLTDLPPLKMTSSPRRLSEDNYRKNSLGSLDEELGPKRRFSDDLKKKPYYTADIFEEYYNQQRKLSEAGIRKSSDASLILNDDTDSFIIGDRVWVSGTKPGAISYIGETQFAPGMWAGVTLDEPIGKNNGTVAGVRYFQCEAKKGVFSRLTRLSRSPLTDYDLEILASRAPTIGSDSPRSTPAHSVMSAPTSYGLSRRSTPNSGLDSRKITPPPQREQVRKVTPSAAFRKPSAPAPPSARKSISQASSFEIRIGERVTIDSNTGMKNGTLRYLGATEFSDGYWAGVELDEPTGKNDGSVAGKKYFVCSPQFGLFAPADRVSRLGSSRRLSGIAVPSSRSSIPSMRRSSSRESLGGSSVASSTVSSLRGTRRPSRTSGYGIGSTSKALQDTLAEKTQHVDQLMRERDIERGDIARMAAQLDEATHVAQEFKIQLDQLQIESEERLHDLSMTVQQLKEEKSEILNKLDDKMKDIDDLSFRVEEESIAKTDFECQNITDRSRVKELEDLLRKEKKKNVEIGEKEANQVCEMEENELDLRSSIDELQANVMELEDDKENLSKNIEDFEERSKKHETELSSKSILIKELEQKIKLLESTNICKDQMYVKERDEKMKNLEDNFVVEKNTSDKKIQKLKMENVCAVENIKELEKNLKSVNVMMEDKIRLLTENNVNLNEEMSAKHKFHKKVEELEQDVVKYVEAQKNDRNTIYKLAQENIDFQTKLCEMNKLEDTLKLNLDESKELKHQLEDSMLNKNTLNETKDHLEQQLKAVQCSSSSYVDEIKKLSDQLQKMETKMHEAVKSEKLATTQLNSEKECGIEQKIQFHNEIEQMKLNYEENLISSEKKLEVLGSNDAREISEIKLQVKVLYEDNKNISTRLKEQEEIHQIAINSVKEDNVRDQIETSRIYAKELDILKKQISDSEIKLETMIESKKCLQEQLQSVSSSSSSTSEQVFNLTEQLTKVTNQMSHAMESEKLLAAKLDSEIEFHSQKFEKLTIEKKEVELELEKRLSEKKCAIEDLKLLSSTVELTLNQKIIQLELEKQKLFSTATEEEKSYRGIIERMSDEIKELQIEITQTRDCAVLELKKELTNSNLKQELLTESNKCIEEKLQSALSLSTNYSNQVTNAEDQLRKLEIQVIEVTESEKLLDIKLNVAKDSHAGEINAKSEDMNTLQEKYTKDLFSVTCELDQVKRDKTDIITDLTSKMENINKENIRLQSDLDELKATCDNNLAEKCIDASRREVLEAENSSLEEKQKTFDINVQNLTKLTDDYSILEQKLLGAIDTNKDLKDGHAEIVELKQSIITFSEKIEKISKEKADLAGEMTVLIDSTSKLKVSFDSLKDEEALRKKEFMTMESELLNFQSMKEDHSISLNIISDLRKESRLLLTKIDELQTVHERNEDLDSKVLLLNQSVLLVQEKLGVQILNLETEKKNLIEEVVLFEEEIAKLKSELKAEGEKVPPVPNEEKKVDDREAAELRLKLLGFQKEKRQLEAEVKEWQEKSLLLSSNGEQGDRFVIELKQERDQFEGQVNFLNSIIVDLQKNKDELLETISVLRTTNVPDLRVSAKKPKAPRLYCDICDRFDIHDTEECPTQTCGASESPPASAYNGDRSAERLYCTLCEVFDHVAGECPEDDTF